MVDITKHEGKKYLRNIRSALRGNIRHLEVDVYCVIAAFPAYMCPGANAARDHALKKILMPGGRGKGTAIDDMKGAIAALHRAIEMEQESLDSTTVPKESLEAKWEAVPCYENESKFGYNPATQHPGECYGWKVRWSIPDSKERYLWVRHYLTDNEPGSPSLAWCEVAAKNNARDFNASGRHPTEFPGYTPENVV